MTAVTLEEDKRNCYEKIKNRLLTNNFYDSDLPDKKWNTAFYFSNHVKYVC